MQWILERIEENQAVFASTTPHPTHGWIEIFCKFTKQKFNFDDNWGDSYVGEYVDDFEVQRLEDEEQNAIEFMEFNEMDLQEKLNKEIEKNCYPFFMMN